MFTRILYPNEVSIAAEALRKGDLVAIPTETVYGLAARYDLPFSINKIFETKKRPNDNPLILHISKLSQVEKIASSLPDLFYILADKFFPGPLTLIVKKHPNVPSCVTAGCDSVAIRMPSHPLTLQLLDYIDIPIAAPSANLSGKPSSTNAGDVLEDFNGKIPFILDGGPCKKGMESTVIDLTQKKPALLRPGALSRQVIEQFLCTSLSMPTKTPCPGMKYKHYSPEATVLLSKNHPQIGSNEKIMVLSNSKGITFNQQNLYALFRQADRQGYDKIIVVLCNETLKDETLMNRLEKASSGLLCYHE
jgi:L-threonylcarbamoyladenylate synthase